MYTKLQCQLLYTLRLTSSFSCCNEFADHKFHNDDLHRSNKSKSNDLQTLRCDSKRNPKARNSAPVAQLLHCTISVSHKAFNGLRTHSRMQTCR